MKMTHDSWLKSIWKIVTHPAVEVIAAIVLVLLATWIVVSTEALHHRVPHFPVPFM